MGKKKKNQSFRLRKNKTFLISICFLLVILIGYLTGVLYYQDKFLSGTIINGHDVSNMTGNESNQVI